MKSDLRTAVILAFAAIAIYSPLIGWGLPYATTADRVFTLAVDEILPLQALAEMHNTFVASKADRNYGYPWWHYFVLSSWQAPYVGYLKLSGQMSAIAPVYPFGMKNPVEALRNLTLWGRFLSVLMGAGIVVMAYFFSKTLWDNRTGVLTACLVLVSYPQVYYSRLGNVDTAHFFWSAIGLVVFARILKDGFTSSRAIWLGISAGLGMAAKDQAFIFFFPLGIALLFPAYNRNRDGKDYQYPTRALLYGLTAAGITYLFATGMLVDPKRHYTHVYSLLFNPNRLTYMPFYDPPLPKTASGIFEMLRRSADGLTAMISLPVLIAAAFGGWVAIRRAPRYLVFLLPLLVLFVILTLPTGTVVYRYFYPLTFLIDAFAASALIWFGTKHNRWVMAGFIAIVIGWRTLIVADLSYAQFHETRTLAGDWFQAHAKPGDTIEFFGPEVYMPPLSSEILSRRVAGRQAWRKESGHGGYVLDYLKQQGPRFIYVSPDHTSRPHTLERSGDCPPEVYQALLDGSAGYRLVAYFPTPSLLSPPLKRPRLDYPTVSPPVRIFEKTSSQLVP